MRKALAAFVQSLNRVSSVAAQVDAEIAIAMSPGVRERHETQLAGSVIILSGYFESFLHDVVKAFIDGICARSLPFAGLPAKLRDTHYNEGALLLQKFVLGRARWVAGPREDLVKRMHSVQGAAPYTLFWEAFASTDSNPGPSTVKNILERCDVKHPWKQIQLHSKRKLAFTLIETELKSFMFMRNECAHTGKSTHAPTTTQVRDFIVMLDDLGEGVTGALETRLAGL